MMFRRIAIASICLLLGWVGVTDSFALEPIKGPANDQLSTGNGEIMGSLGYPSDEVPALQIVAFLQSNPRVYYRIDVPKAQSRFLIPNVPPGVYLVVAYPLDSPMRGGYSERRCMVSERPIPDPDVRPWGRYEIVKLGTVLRRPGSVVLRRAEELHQVTDVLPGTLTLVLWGRKRRPWGFQTEFGWVAWRSYLGINR